MLVEVAVIVIMEEVKLVVIWVGLIIIVVIKVAVPFSRDSTRR